MGNIDPAALELMKWQENQKPSSTAVQPLPATNRRITRTEDILASTHPSLMGQDVGDDMVSQNDTDESDDDSQDEDSDSSDAEEDYEYTLSPQGNSRPQRQAPVMMSPRDNRPSSKRRREHDYDHRDTQYQGPPPIYPTYNAYAANNGQLQLPTHQMQLSGPTTGMGGYPLHNGGSSVPMMPPNQNGLNIGTGDPFGGYDIYNGPNFQTGSLQEMLPARTQKVPEVPKAKKTKNSKSSKSRVSMRNGRTRGQLGMNF